MSVAARSLSDLEALEQLVIDNPDLERLESLLDQFNIFEAIGAVRQEVRHSDFLAFLLNPQQNHGLGDSFTKAILQKVLLASKGSDLPVSLIDLDVWELEDAIVLREWHNIDILLVNEANRLIVVIENKIGSSESADQLVRYHRIIDDHYPGWKTIALYLTPEGELPTDDRYLPVSYKLIAEQVEALTERRASTLGPDIKTLMAHYAGMLRRHIVGGSEIDELCSRIYGKHQRALDLIFERRPDMQSNIRDLISSIVAETEGIDRERVSKWEVHFVPTVWDACIPKVESPWSPGGRVLKFYFLNEPNKLRLVLTIGPGPARLREFLLDLAQRNRDLFRPSKRITRKWSQVMAWPILSPADYEDAQLDEIEAKLRQFWNRFTSHDLPPIVGCVEREMGSYRPTIGS